MSEWREVQIGDVCRVGDGAHAKVNRQEKGVLYLTSKNFDSGSLKLDNVDFISEEDYEKFFPEKSKAVTKLQSNDVLIGIIGTFGNAYKYKEADFFGVSSSVAIIRPQASELNSDFLVYLLNSENFKFIHQAYSSGSVQGYSNIPTIKSMPITIPSLQTQEKIVSAFKPLDRKISNLRQQNETLEAIAQTLFKHWFVDFEFPNEDGKPYKSSGGEMVRSELGKIPEGWHIGTLEDFCNVKHGYAFKGEFITAEETEQILLTPGNFKIGGGFNSSKYKYYSNDDYDKDYILELGDLIITMTDLSKEGDTLGYPAFVPKHGSNIFLHNQRLGKVIDSQIVLFFLFFLLCRRDYRSHILGTASGSTVRHTSPSRILEYEFTVPNKELLDRFSLIASNLISKNFANYKQIETLYQTRDVLLPKLMSGQIRII